MSKDLISRLNEGPVLCAEGYLFAMERRGYLQAGAFVPEVVLEHPEVVTQLHREFIRGGSDVVQAFTYYGHREKLRLIGKEKLLEPLQKNALKEIKCDVRFAVLWWNNEIEFEPDYYVNEIAKDSTNTWIHFPWETWWNTPV